MGDTSFVAMNKFAVLCCFLLCMTHVQHVSGIEWVNWINGEEHEFCLQKLCFRNYYCEKFYDYLMAPFRCCNTSRLLKAFFCKCNYQNLETMCRMVRTSNNDYNINKKYDTPDI